MESPAVGARTPSMEVEGALLAATEIVLCRHGSGAVTIRAVAEEAGVAPAGVYSRFGGKDGLIQALKDRGFARFGAYVNEAEGDNPIDRLHNSGLRYRKFAIDNPQLYTVMFESESPAGSGTDRKPGSDDLAFSILVGQVYNVLCYIRPSGSPITGLESTEVAQHLWSAVHGAVTLELKGLIKTADPLDSYNKLLNLLMSGITSSTD